MNKLTITLMALMSLTIATVHADTTVQINPDHQNMIGATEVVLNDDDGRFIKSLARAVIETTSLQTQPMREDTIIHSIGAVASDRFPVMSIKWKFTVDVIFDAAIELRQKLGLVTIPHGA